MKYQIAPIALLLALASCGDHKQASQADTNAQKDTLVNIDTAQKPKAAEQKIEVIDTANIFNKEYAAKHYFSNFKHKDNFTLKLSGTDLLNAKGILQIKDAQGQLLYEYKFTTPDLFIDPKSMPAADKTKKLNEIFDHYFDEDNFKSPAIDSKESFENAFSNPDNTIKTAWEEIKANKKAIRFSHREGYEGLISIAFSPLNKKTIPVSYSD